MKTKHLLYTLALAGTLAACTSEEFITDTPQDNLKADRPTVSNVILNVTRDNDAVTRLTFDGSFSWENGDKIAALLMDENNTGVRYGSATGTNEWNALSWLEKYHLVDYVHTNFAFAYNASTGKWNSTGDCNMLEGNYFLTYPYVSFDGKRQAYYDISKQKQIGNTGEARREAYAKNQVFVGYAQLEAKAGASVLNAKMSEVLAPVRIDIQSNCTEVSSEPLTVNKIVLQNCTFSSHYTIDPTNACYGPDNSIQWNLENYSYSGIEGDQNTYIPGELHFNYANYLDAAGMKNCKGVELYNHYQYGSVAKSDYVYNIADNKVGNVNDLWDINPDFDTRRKTKAYYYDDAIRKVVRPLNKYNWTENTTSYIEVYTYDTYGEAADGTVTSTPMTLKSGYNSKLGVIAMVPEFENNCLELYIYTNKGVVGPVALDYIHNGNTDSGVQTTDAILAAHPSMAMQTVTVIIDDDDIVRTPYNMLINNTDDLVNYVQWATINPTAAKLEVTLTNDVTIDDKLAAAIKGIKKENGILYFYGSSNKMANVKLATTSAQADILEYIDLNEYTLVEVLDGATVNLTQAAHNYLYDKYNSSTLNILVDKGGVLNVSDSNKPGVGGWVSTNSAYTDVQLENNGVVNVKAKVSKNAGISLTNKEGVFNVEKDAQIILSINSMNTIKGTINIAKGGELTGTTEQNMANYGVINNAGELYNVENLLAINDPAKVLPGRIYITDIASITMLDTNKGKVIYHVLPTTPVEVNDGLNNNYMEGIFEFTTNNDVTTEALTKARVTDFTITDGATLFVNNPFPALRHLTVKNANVKGGNAPLVDAFTFGQASAGTPLANASWNVGKYNTIKLIGNSSVTDVKFTLGNLNLDSPQVALINDGTKKDITFNGEVEFLDRANDYAVIDLYSVTLTAELNATVKVDKFVVTARPEVSSTIKIKTGATITATGTPKYDAGAIVVSGSSIK